MAIFHPLRTRPDETAAYRLDLVKAALSINVDMLPMVDMLEAGLFTLLAVLKGQRGSQRMLELDCMSLGKLYISISRYGADY